MKRLILFALGLLAFSLLSCSSKTATQAPPAAPSPPQHDMRIKTLLDALEANYEIDADADFKLEWEFDNGRNQIVYVNSNTEEYENMEIREVWSFAHKEEAPLPGWMANKLLESSSTIKWGAWHVMGKGPYFVVFVVKLEANSSAQMLSDAMKIVREQADKMEIELNGDDDY